MSKFLSVLSLLAAFAVSTVAAQAADCCKPGGDCCKPGATCCKK